MATNFNNAKGDNQVVGTQNLNQGRDQTNNEKGNLILCKDSNIGGNALQAIGTSSPEENNQKLLDIIKEKDAKIAELQDENKQKDAKIEEYREKYVKLLEKHVQ